MNNKIDDNDLENVSGGVLFNSTGISGADPEKPWEVLDDHTGEIIYFNGKKQVFKTRKEAIDAAKRLGLNTMEFTWDQVLEKRGMK